MNNINCIIADKQKEVFDNLCKEALDIKLQIKFGEYAEIICNTKADENGGEAFLTFGIYNLQDELCNFSKELSCNLNISQDEANSLIQKYIEIFNITADIEWDKENLKPNISIFLDEPFVDELTPEDDLELIRNEDKMAISEKIGDCIEIFVKTFMDEAELHFSYKWNEWNTCNPE